LLPSGWGIDHLARWGERNHDVLSFLFKDSYHYQLM
jgi:hypothetical protein